MTNRLWLFNNTNGTTGTLSNILANDGTAVTVANMGSGGSITFVNTSPFVQEGTTALQLVVAAGITGSVRFPLPAATNSASWEFYHGATALPSQDTVIATVRHASGICGRVLLLTSGAIRITDTSNVTIATSSTGVWAINRRNRFAVVAKTATTTTGELSVSIYNDQGTTALATVSTTTSNLTTNQISHFDLGAPGTGPTGGWTQVVDSLQTNDVGGSQIGPYVPTTPLGTPVVTLVSDTDATVNGGSDGQIVVSWPAVTDAVAYTVDLAPGASATTGFVTKSTTATSPYTITGLTAGAYTVGVTATP